MKLGKLLPFQRPDAAPAELSDETLMAGAESGDVTALGALFDRHHRALYAFLSRVSGAPGAELDDIVQATFLEISRGAARYGGRAAVRTWLFGVAANVARRSTRRETQRRVLLGNASQLPVGSPTRPDEAVEYRELVAALGAALAALPHDLRVAYVMCELEEVSGSEAARALGVREGTLWRRLHDARKRLRAALEAAEVRR